jgi:hypothetical protein
LISDGRTAAVVHGSGSGRRGVVLLLVPAVGARLLATRPCEEIYVVGEGETLHSISAWCGDPYILERNSHVHDPDDDFPGLVIRITKVNDERQQAASVILHRTSTMASTSRGVRLDPCSRDQTPTVCTTWACRKKLLDESLSCWRVCI